jgi:hypothetical protein
VDIKLKDLDKLLATLAKHNVAEFESGPLKLKLEQKPKAATKIIEKTQIQRQKTAEQQAEDILFMSAR